MELLKKCPICNSSEIFHKHTIIDYSISKEAFKLTECSNCNFLFTNPRPDSKDIASYYASENYISHSNKIKSPIGLLYKIVRYFMLRKKRKIIEKRSSKGVLLDIGCGTAHFLKHCSHKGWEVFGIETDKGTRQQSIEKNNIKIYQTIEEIDKKKKFDAITLWHVLEHIHDIDKVLRDIFARLKDNGTLFIAVPNRISYDAQYYKEYWAGYDVPRHLYHFSHNDVIRLLKNNNLIITETIPMPFDAYYVSLLSHTYKYGRKSFLIPLTKAFISNRKASKNNNNYSSSIFVFKK